MVDGLQLIPAIYLRLTYMILFFTHCVFQLSPPSSEPAVMAWATLGAMVPQLQPVKVCVRQLVDLAGRLLHHSFWLDGLLRISLCVWGIVSVFKIAVRLARDV